MADKSKSPAQRLDLGLSEILSRSGDAPSTLPPELPPERAATSVVSLSDADGRLNSEFLSLAEGRKWGVLVSRAEATFSTGDDIEARLWWIRGHLGAFSLPVSLLAAPFETVCRHADDTAKERFRSLFVEIGNVMLSRLREVGDKRQEYAVRLALHQIGLLESSEEYTRSLPPKVPSLTESAVVESREPSAWPLPPVSVTHKRSKAKWYGVGGLLVCVATVWLLLTNFSGSPASVASEGFISSRPPLDLQLPGVRAREVVSNLGALFYSLSDTPKAEPAAVVPADLPAPAPEKKLENAKRKIDSQPAAVEKPAPPAKRKEVVRTDGPLESPEFRREMHRQTAPHEARLPDPLFGRPPAPEMRSPFPDGVGGSVGSVKSVIASTDVFASPSYRARVLGRLLVGDEVSVEGQVGRWLRIRSKKGRVGFIYSQDVGEREDFRAESPAQ
jgi:hypothetical protein